MVTTGVTATVTAIRVAVATVEEAMVDMGAAAGAAVAVITTGAAETTALAQAPSTARQTAAILIFWVWWP